MALLPISKFPMALGMMDVVMKISKQERLQRKMTWACRGVFQQERGKWPASFPLRSPGTKAGEWLPLGAADGGGRGSPREGTLTLLWFNISASKLQWGRADGQWRKQCFRRLKEDDTEGKNVEGWEKRFTETFRHRLEGKQKIRAENQPRARRHPFVHWEQT